MLRYRVLKTDNDQQISLALNTSNIDKKNIDEDDGYEPIINDPKNLEKESYKAKASYKINFNFYKNGYATSFNNAGFNLPDDINKNIYKKSLFLVEFYDNLTSKNRIFSTTLSVYPNVKGQKGPVSTVNNNIREVKSIYDITEPLNEMFFIYNYRDFSNFTDIKLNSDGAEYASMFVKIMFLNAKTGDVQYFIADTNTTTTLTSGEFTDDLFYYEVRFYKNYTFSFYKNGAEQTNIFFKELVVQ